MEIDKELMTVSIYGIEPDTEGMPQDGAIILVRSVKAMKLFLNHNCQLTTELKSAQVDQDRGRALV
jgi:hypothetical protein